MKGWGFAPEVWDRFATWLVRSNDRDMHRSQGVGALRAGLRHDAGDRLSAQDQAWLTSGATAHATQLALLDRIRDATDAEVLVLKGPEVASCYPAPAWRCSSDLDLFCLDAPGLWEALVRAGFAPVEPVGRHDRHHHLTPLQLSGFRLGVEVHRGLGWPRGALEPSAGEVVATSVAARSHDGFSALEPSLAFAHQLQHAWHAVPYGTVRDLVDLSLLWDQSDPVELERSLAELGLDRLHASTRRFGLHVLAGTPTRVHPVAQVVARPTSRGRSETMRLAVPRRVAGMVAAAGVGFTARSVAHDVAVAAARRRRG